MTNYEINYENKTKYIGEIRDDNPHGSGTMIFENGDVYNGQFYYGKCDGFGVYEYAIGAKYTGFFSYDKFHGVGTYETNKEITKGTWRQDIKHGIFHTKDKINKRCRRIVFIDGKRISEIEVNPFPESYLMTYPTKKQIVRKTKVKVHECSVCHEKKEDIRLLGCGHTTCITCLNKCKICPFCRSEIYNVGKIYLSKNET